MFGKLFGRKPKAAAPGHMVIAHLNARLQPIHRGEHFEDPLDEALRGAARGQVSGGGTAQMATGEIESCDIELKLPAIDDDVLRFVVATLEGFGAPKGSRLLKADVEINWPFGGTEGLAVYLNGTDLPVEVYQSSDVNFVLSEFARLLGSVGRVLSHWEGAAETAVYVYGPAFAEMKARLEPFLATYPLCQRRRVVQIG